MANNDNQIPIILTADNATLLAALQKSQDKIKELEDQGKSAAQGLSAGFEGLSVGGLAKMAFGFGTMAGAADKALGFIVDKIKEIAEIIPKAIESTNKLVETYEQLGLTAGTTVEQFNALQAAVALSGGKIDDVQSIVYGMTKGIRKNEEALIAEGIAADKAGLMHLSLQEYISRVVERTKEYGTAQEKNQLLQDAFGKSGPAFALLLEKLNERYKEGEEIAGRNGVLNQQALVNENALEQAKGRTAYQQEILNRRIAEGASPYAIKIEAMKAERLEALNMQPVVAELIRTNKIIAVQKSEQLEGNTVLVTDWEATLKLAREYLDTQRGITKEQQQQAREKTETEAKAAYEGKAKAEREKKAAEDAKKAAEEAKQAKKQLEDISHRINTEDLATAENVTLAQKQALAIRQAQDKLQGTLRSIDSTLEKSPGEANKKAAEDARLAARKLYADQLNKIDRDSTAEGNKVQEAADKASLQEFNRIEDLKLSDKLKTIDATNKAEIEEITFQRVLGNTTEEDMLKRVASSNARRNDLERDAMLERLEMRSRESTLDLVAVQKLDNELKALKAKHDAEAKKANQALYLEMRNKSPMAGLRDGAQQYIESAKNNFKNFGSAITKIMQAAESGIQNALKGLITGQMTFGEAMKGIWVGIGTAILDIVTQMIAQWAVAAVAQAIFGTTTKVVENEKAAAELDTGAAGAWAAYSWMPFIGPALAEAQIIAMLASFGAAKAANRAITAFASGGLVTQPRLGLVGEAGNEYIVPEKSMASLVPGLMDSGARIYGAMARSQARTNAYSKTTNYAPTSNTTRTTNTTGHTFNISGVIGDQRQLGTYLKKVINNHTLVYGSAI